MEATNLLVLLVLVLAYQFLQSNLAQCIALDFGSRRRQRKPPLPTPCAATIVSDCKVTARDGHGSGRLFALRRQQVQLLSQTKEFVGHQDLWQAVVTCRMEAPKLSSNCMAESCGEYL